jgi:hypothetical protein
LDLAGVPQPELDLKISVAVDPSILSNISPSTHRIILTSFPARRRVDVQLRSPEFRGLWRLQPRRTYAVDAHEVAARRGSIVVYFPDPEHKTSPSTTTREVVVAVRTVVRRSKSNPSHPLD